MNSLLEEMESDTTRTPSIGDNSLKEMSDLCAEQAAIEEEIKQLEEQVKAKSKAARKLSQEIIPAKMQELGPQFCLKMRWLQASAFNTKGGEYEWFH